MPREGPSRMDELLITTAAEMREVRKDLEKGDARFDALDSVCSAMSTNVGDLQRRVELLERAAGAQRRGLTKFQKALITAIAGAILTLGGAALNTLAGKVGGKPSETKEAKP